MSRRVLFIVVPVLVALAVTALVVRWDSGCRQVDSGCRRLVSQYADVEYGVWASVEEDDAGAVWLVVGGQSYPYDGGELAFWGTPHTEFPDPERARAMRHVGNMDYPVIFHYLPGQWVIQAVYRARDGQRLFGA